ncbi:13778_t:CDS:1, partial [Funneliformis geosporum]
NGYVIPISTKFMNGKIIRLAIICCSNDIPATRKLCGYISALTGCHQCYKRTNTGGRKPNFGGFEDMDDWLQKRDLEEHLRNAEGWQ